MGHYHSDDAAVFQVQVNAAGVEQAGHILVGGVASALPDAVQRFALPFQFLAQDGGGVAVVEPGRVADDDVHFGAAQGHRAHQVAGVVGPDVVAAGLVQLLHSGEGGGQGAALGGVGDGVVVQGQQGVVAGLNVGGGLAQEGVEGVGAVHQADGEGERGAGVVIHLDGDFPFGEQVAGAEAQLQGVAQIDGYGAGGVVAGGAGGGHGGAGGEGPGGAGEVDGGGMHVNAGYRRAEAVQGGPGFQFGLARRRQVMAYGGGDEGSRAAGGVQYPLAQGIGDDFPHHRLGQPVGGVVFAQGAAFCGGDDGFVEDGGDVGGRAGAVFAGPVEAGQAAGQGAEQRGAADLGGPGEEVGGDDAVQSGGVAEAAALEQVGGVGFGHLADVHAEGGLHGDAHHQGEVGVADKEVVQFGGGVGDFAEGGGEQVLPEAALDLDGFVAGGAA